MYDKLGRRFLAGDGGSDAEDPRSVALLHVAEPDRGLRPHPVNGARVEDEVGLGVLDGMAVDFVLDTSIDRRFL